MSKSEKSVMPDTPTTEPALHRIGATSGAAGSPTPSSTASGAPATRPRPVPGPESRPKAVAAPRAGTPSRINGRPAGPAEMRREIERTRARMSGTLDALEARVAHEKASLERKKDELVDRATLKGFRQKLAREPWRSVALAFAAGYIVAAIRD